MMFFDIDKINIGVNTFPKESNTFQTSNIFSNRYFRNNSLYTEGNYFYDYISINIDSTSEISDDLVFITNEFEYIAQKIYPAGIYISTSSTNPSYYFGGSWSLCGLERVSVGINKKDSDFFYLEIKRKQNLNTFLQIRCYLTFIQFIRVYLMALLLLSWRHYS
jgi:hypothetical protein